MLAGVNPDAAAPRGDLHSHLRSDLHSELRGGPRGGPRDDLLDDLDERQRDAVTAPAGSPLAILAPAGSGKTRVLTRRIAHLARSGDIDPRHTMAVTFTRKAAGELIERLGHLDARDVTAGTFHALCLAQLRRRQAGRNRELPALLERKGRILGPILGGRGDGQVAAINEVAGEIEWAKARGVRPDQFVTAVHGADRDTPRPAEQLAAIYERYEREKRRRRLIDFDDLLWWCAEALEGDDDFAASVRFRHRFLFVDEFQDVSPAQLRVLRAWLGARPDLCVVGDEAQAIYGFAGAESSVLVNFARHFPGGRVVRLAVNYRSTPQVVATADAVLASPSGRPRPVPVSVRDDGPAPAVHEFESDDAEAKGVALLVRDAHDRGVPWSRIAVLYRTNAQSAAFEQALQRLGVPYRLPGVGAFLQRPEVKAELARLRRAERAAPGRPLADHLNDLLAGDETADETGRDAEPSDGAAREARGELDEPHAGERGQHADVLVHFGHEYLAAEGSAGSLSGFVAWLTATTRNEADPLERDAVELLSYHRAKGLEFDVVCVTGLEAGLVPISYARTPEAKAEEQRLLHVALSRAIDELHVSWAASRAIRGRERTRRPSPWLDTIRRVAAGLPPPAAADPREGLRAIRSTLDAVRPDDLPPLDRKLFDALREWRLHEARSAEVPAYVVFNDATLTHIAQRRPDTLVALREIPGIGPTKIERHGDAVLEVVRRHAT
jgi:DNA helicase-2/ATP-dependent DNA helicase PcrA